MQYFEPNFVNEALVVLERFGPRAKALAGGTRLGPSLRGDCGDVVALVNLKRIASLAAITSEHGRMRIGALVTAAELAHSPSIVAAAPLLSLAAASMGSRQLRALASIGGNICSGDAASDLTTALLACDAACVFAALNHGERRLALSDVLVPGGTICAPGELLVAVEVPRCDGLTAFEKMTTRRGFEMALVAVAVTITMEGARAVSVRIALAGAGPTCQRATNAERFATAESPDGYGREWGERVGAVAAERDAAPDSDERAGADYRRHLVAVLTARALRTALGRRA